MNEGNDLFVRGLIEHQVLPEQLFNNTKQLIGALATKGNEVLFNLYNEVMPGKYTPEDFAVKAASNKLGGLSVVARLPLPDAPLACTVIGMLCGKDGSNPGYYTVETTVDGEFLLCMKPDNNSHAILAEDCGNTLEEHLKAILNYMEIGFLKENQT